MLSAEKRTAPYMVLTFTMVGLLLYAIGVDGLISYYRTQGVDLQYLWLAVAAGFGALAAGLWFALRKMGSVAIAIGVVVLCLTLTSWIGLTR